MAPPERAFLDRVHCNTLYIKFLDIARDPESRQIVPYSLLEVEDTTGLSGKQIIPVVFITNSVFQNISEKEISTLAEKTAASLAANGRRFPPACLPFCEIQFDCDWTGSTRAAFFRFLKNIRPLLPRETRISATVRLHQFKFPKETGVPPVERGVLMLYNTGNIADTATINSIYDPQDAAAYLQPRRSSYPLPLDVALPLFSWGLVFREGEFWKILPEPVWPEEGDSCIVRETSAPGRWYRVQKGTFRAGHYLLPGDRIRLECTDTLLLEQIQQAAHQLPTAGDARFIFYHLDTLVIRRFSVPFLQKCL